MRKQTSGPLWSLALCLVAGALATTAHAASAVRPQGRFDDRVMHREGGVIATAPRNVEELAPTDPARRGWEGIRGRDGGRWRVYLDERTAMPALATGQGIEWLSAGKVDDATLADLEAAARTFLADHVSLLGDWTTWLELDDDASAPLRAGYWKLVFRQRVDGVRIENARLEFHVDQGRLTMLGASNWGVPTSTGKPTLNEQDAREFLDAYLGVSTSEFILEGEPELVLVALDAAPAADRPRRWVGPRGSGVTHALVWRLKFQDPDDPALWVGEIDAHDGRVRAFYDGAHYGAVRGGVFPEQPDGDCTAGGCELDDFPMPFADWTEAGQAEQFADPYGNFTCADPGASFETRLVGQYVEVDDTCGSIVESATCDGPAQLGVKQGEDCEVEPYGSPGNTAAARSSYYHINRVAEIARFYNPGNAWLNGRVILRSNWVGTCNASYSADQIYVYREGNGCANSGEIQGIAVHEWGHGYDQNDGGGTDNTSEVYADLVAMLASRQSCFGPGLFIDGWVCTGYGDTCLTCTGFRDHDWAARQANTPATPQAFVQNNCGSGTGPCGGETHCETYPVGEAMYDLATRDLPGVGIDVDTAWQLMDRLWYSTRAGSGGDIYNCALPSSDSCSAGSWYQQLRAADDDDADLSNGTPHAAELYAAFARHNIACGLPEDADNQSTSSCPALVTPLLTVTAVPSGTELTWGAVSGASEYVVHRGDLGCQRQQVPVATIPAGTTSWLDSVGDPDVIRYYRAEAVGANPVCRSAVSNCETNPQGPRLQMNSHRLIEAGSNTNGNGLLDPGETVLVPVTLFNGGTADALNVTGRLRTVDPAQGRVVEPLADWPDIAVAAEFESNAPHFELTLFNSDVACGDTVAVELEMAASGAAVRSRTFDYTLGEVNREYFTSAGLPISRLSTQPVLSIFEMTDDTVIGDLDVSVAISHTNPANLIVELSSPLGTTVRLHDNSPGSGGIFTRYDLDTAPDGPGTMADFAGESTAGTWTLSAQNTTIVNGEGTFESWTLHVASEGAFDCNALTCPEPPPAQALDGLLVDKLVNGGDGSVELSFSWNGVGGVAGYHLLQSNVATFDSPVDLTGRTAGAVTLSVDNVESDTAAVTFYQVRAINTCNEESP